MKDCSEGMNGTIKHTLRKTWNEELRLSQVKPNFGELVDTLNTHIDVQTSLLKESRVLLDNLKQVFKNKENLR